MLGADEISGQRYNRVAHFRHVGYISPPPPNPAPVCRKYERCAGCPYPRHGYVCWNRDGSCLRTEMKNIYKKREDDTK